jgi:hypothetical protein
MILSTVLSRTLPEILTGFSEMLHYIKDQISNLS